MDSPKGHVPFLDGIRGIAILSVFLFHALVSGFETNCLPWDGLLRNYDTSLAFLLLQPLTYGFTGVAAFFVVSGFCVHLSYRRSANAGWSGFYWRRFFRLYPAYLLALVTFLFLWPWGPTLTPPQIATQLGTHLGLIHNFFKDTFFGINPSFWSIAAEVQLYAIYPLLLWITAKGGWRNGLLLAAALELAIRSVESLASFVPERSLPLPIVVSPFAFWFSWSLGAHLAQCFLEGKRSRLSAWRFDLIALLAIAMPLFKPTAPFTFTAIALVTGLAIDRLISGEWSGPASKWARKVWAHLSFLGVVSYGFYLLHHPIVMVTPRALRWLFPGHDFSPFSIFSICCAWYPVLLFLSYGVHKAVEQPSVRLGKSLWRRMRCKPEAVAEQRGVEGL